MQGFLCSTILLCSSLCYSEEAPLAAFEIDDRGSLAQALQYSAKGKWHELSNKSLPFEEFTQIRGLQHLLFENTPYSGWYGQWDDNGKLRNLRYFSEGLLEGPIFSWRDNGNKHHQGYYKKGRKDGVFISWANNLTKVKEQNFKNGKLHGTSLAWYENGNKSAQQTFKEGKILEAIGWKPNGELCPSTEVIDGVGTIISYPENSPDQTLDSPKPEKLFVVEKYENGNKREEGNYLNGKKTGLWIYYRTDGSEFFRRTYRAKDEGSPSSLLPLKAKPK